MAQFAESYKLYKDHCEACKECEALLRFSRGFEGREATSRACSCSPFHDISRNLQAIWMIAVPRPVFRTVQRWCDINGRI